MNSTVPSVSCFFAFCFSPADCKDKFSYTLLHHTSQLCLFFLQTVFFLNNWCYLKRAFFSSFYLTKISSDCAIYSFRMKRFLCWERSHISKRSLMTSKRWPLTPTSFPLLVNRWGKTTEIKHFEQWTENKTTHLHPTDTENHVFVLYEFLFSFKGYIPQNKNVFVCLFVSTLQEWIMSMTNFPPAQVIMDLKGSDYGWSYQTPPSSPSTTMSRKSSMCR